MVFRYDNKEEALDMCSKHEDCGGISQNRDGSFECRAKEFIKENGAISFKKPRNFKSPVYTQDDVDPGESIYMNRVGMRKSISLTGHILQSLYPF